ncbi:hypothetical protein [Pseudomonas helleri]|uniref:hypothetical protein n=1 Tax=Pseudomonas helleri TaxID=1608996 RepID=UPI003FD4B921
MTNKQAIDGLSRAALEALKSARLFISNGIDLGFIRMPDSETPDPAHNTLPMIDKAIQELRALLDKPAAWERDMDYRPEELGSPETEPECHTCNDTKMVDDGELTHSEGGIPYANGPIKCVKDCPDCSKPAAQHQGEPVAWVSPESLGGVRWRPKVLDGLADGAPLYCRPPEQVAPLAAEAAKAFAKGFNTLESGGGKYRINMQFQSREDAWGAFNVLARLKQLNTPQ